MPLNPAYTSQTTRPLPFCLGYVYVQGDKINTIVGFDGATVEQYILAEGEWESCVYLSVTPGDSFINEGGIIVGGVSIYPHNKFIPPLLFDRLTYYHFHGGSYATKGLPNNLISIGPDQGSENWLRYFPSVTPALCYSGLVYYLVRRILGTTAMNPVGIYRSLKCRVFDAHGNVTGYGFTTNPTWQMIETLLRFQIKCQQPGLEGLTAAEKACFDWPAMVDHAARNAALLANGSPRFTGNWAFAADATLAAMMEAQLRNCRSYRRERGAQIAFMPDDNRAAVFTFSQRNMVPGSLHLAKKDLSTAANVYVPQYRDLGIPAVAQIASIVTAQGSSAGGSGAYFATFDTAGQQPFFSRDVFTYSGGSDDADFAGDYQVKNYTTTIANVPTLIAPPLPTSFDTSYGPQKQVSCTGGYVGTNQSRFKERDPSVVRHRAHQMSLGQIAPNINPLPRATEVRYDFGNNTFDQTNRLMKWMRDRDLGTDGLGWKAPFQGSISASLEAVDDFGHAALEIEEGDVITLDETAAPDFPGTTCEVIERTVTPPSRGALGQVDLVLQSFSSNPNPDVSDPPGDSYQTLPNSLLPMGDTFPLLPEFWLLQATPTGTSDGSGGVTLTISDCQVIFAGDGGPTFYPPVSLAGVPLNQHLTVYLHIAQGSNPTLSLDTVSNNPPIPIPAGQVIVYFGTIASAAAVSASGSSGTGVHGSVASGSGDTGSPNNASLTQPVSTPDGSFSTLTYTPATTYLGGPPVSSDTA